jgi:hypothetical protein
VLGIASAKPPIEFSILFEDESRSPVKIVGGAREEVIDGGFG